MTAQTKYSYWIGKARGSKFWAVTDAGLKAWPNLCFSGDTADEAATKAEKGLTYWINTGRIPRQADKLPWGPLTHTSDETLTFHLKTAKEEQINRLKGKP